MRLALLSVMFVALGLASRADALPPGAEARGFRDGANHHLGDDSFVAAYGRAPTAADGEHARMHVHLAYVRAWLGARPAARPALAARRAELLGYLDEYIAAGITPRNTYVPWRSPVFIDAGGRICAVGYLIERSAGRAAAEAIARDHRLAFLEDIAAARPEVRAWIDGSGLTLDELASIQPGYEGPDVQFERGWTVAELDADGPYRGERDGAVVTGAFARGRMTGAWTRTDAETHKVTGRGRFAGGRGRWRSSYPDGTRLAEGWFVDNRASGAWRFYHPSGRLAAEGSFRRGKRDGDWRFFHDDDARTVIAAGSFSSGYVSGVWRHYDARGHLLATAEATSRGPGDEWIDSGLLLRVRAGADGITHEVHQGIPASSWRLDGLYAGGERIYVRDDGAIYDRDGARLAREDDGSWTASDCRWSPARKRAARTGDLASVHYQLLRHREEPEVCGASRPVSAARARRIQQLLAARTATRAPTPRFVRAYVGSDDDDAPGADPSADADAVTESPPIPTAAPVEPADTSPDPHVTVPEDLVSVLATHMTWYMEWPHIDGLFRTVFGTLPGYHHGSA